MYKILFITLAYMAWIFHLSTIPATAEQTLPILLSAEVQNFLHIPAYALLTFLWILTLRNYGLIESLAIAVATIVSEAYGAITELAQTWVPGRFPSVQDLLFDIAGILVVTSVYWVIQITDKEVSPRAESLREY